jgi:hypothetical protein
MNESNFQRVMRALGKRFQRLRHEADTIDRVPDALSDTTRQQIEALNAGFARVTKELEALREAIILTQPGRAA